MRKQLNCRMNDENFCSFYIFFYFISLWNTKHNTKNIWKVSKNIIICICFLNPIEYILQGVYNYIVTLIVVFFCYYELINEYYNKVKKTY